MDKIIVLLGVVAILSFSCSQPAPVSVAPEVILLQQSNDVLPISSFAESVDYVELKLDKVGVSLGEVLAVKQIDDDWIILHRMSGKSSFIQLNRHGDFIAELAGKNSKEITEPRDIVEYEKGYAVLAENGIHYISKEGKYMRKLSEGNESNGSCFFEEGGKFYILNEKFAGPVVRVASDTKTSEVDKQVLPMQVQRMIYTSVQPFGKSTGYYSVLSDSIYRQTSNEDKNVTKLMGDGITGFAEVVRNMAGMEEKDALKYLRESNHVMVKKYIENREFIYLTYWVGSVSSTYILNKTNGVFHYFGLGVNDIDGGIWEQALCLTEKNELVIPLTAYKIAGHKISNKKVKGFDRLQSNTASGENPVLMLCTLK